MKTKGFHVVTGAYGYSGKYIAERLLARGHEVRTLTNSGNRENPFSGRVTSHPFHFDEPAKLVETLRGADVLYNTYWVRFNHTRFAHAEAVKNTKVLFAAAKEAGVRRVVHVSITNPSVDSELEYFSGKAVLERSLIESGLSYAILRPTVLFGREDILINNIAWMLRRFPLFGLFGDGSYKLQPIYVDDLAALAVACGAEENNNLVDAIGPETFTYRQLVNTVGEIIGCRRLVVALPSVIGWALGWILGKVMRDVTITRAEVEGLMQGLLCVDSVPAGSTKLSDWARANAATLGAQYASELARRRDRKRAYRVIEQSNQKRLAT